jgi:phage terminase small subunit
MVISRGERTESVIKAGYKPSSGTAARVQACRLLANANVRQEMERIEKKLNEDPRYSPEALAAWLHRIGQSAEEKGELATAGNQVMNIAKLCGHLIDQTKVIKDQETEALMSRLQELAPDLLA